MTQYKKFNVEFMALVKQTYPQNRYLLKIEEIVNFLSLGTTFCLQVEKSRISICLKIITVTLVTDAFDLDCLKMVTMIGVLKL